MAEHLADQVPERDVDGSARAVVAGEPGHSAPRRLRVARVDADQQLLERTSCGSCARSSLALAVGVRPRLRLGVPDEPGVGVDADEHVVGAVVPCPTRSPPAGGTAPRTGSPRSPVMRTLGAAAVGGRRQPETGVRDRHRVHHAPASARAPAPPARPAEPAAPWKSSGSPGWLVQVPHARRGTACDRPPRGLVLEVQATCAIAPRTNGTSPTHVNSSPASAHRPAREVPGDALLVGRRAPTRRSGACRAAARACACGGRSETSTSGGSSDTEVNAFAVIAWTSLAARRRHDGHARGEAPERPPHRGRVDPLDRGAHRPPPLSGRCRRRRAAGTG